MFGEVKFVIVKASRERIHERKRDRNLVDSASSIRLSQRLSHACLSINDYTVKLRMAHYISYSLFDGLYYLDNRSNSRANTCLQPRLRNRCIY